MIVGPRKSGKSTLSEWIASSTGRKVNKCPESHPPVWRDKNAELAFREEWLCVWERSLMTLAMLDEVSGYPGELVVETIEIPDTVEPTTYSNITIVYTRPSALKLSSYGIPIGRSMEVTYQGRRSNG